MEVTLRIKRYNPDLDVKPTFREYQVQVETTYRLLDALNKIKWFQDGLLTCGRSCAHGIYGSDAMKVNGLNRRACKLLFGDLAQRITIKPHLIADESPIHEERRQSPVQRERYDDTSKCILCAACTSSCPITWPHTGYVGPAAIVNAHRFIFDSGDTGANERLRLLDGNTGVWRCRTIFNCTEVCPRGIQVTRAIAEVKRVHQYGEV